MFNCVLASMAYIPDLIGRGLSFRFDGFRIVYAAITTVMWLCSTMLSKEYFTPAKELKRYYSFSALTYIATVGVFLSGDLYTTFCFFEMMSFTSYVLVVQTEKKEALRAGGTYLAVAVIGGLVMLMGLFMLFDMIGTLDIASIRPACSAILSGGDPVQIKRLYWAGGLILFGFGAKAGMFPLHIWLPKAHPVAPAPASALLSGVLTKSGIYGILILSMEVFFESRSFGLAVYILGLVTMLTGALLAVFSTDLKRTLACSSVSQIGFILVGIGLIPMMGEECPLAAAGSLLYMVNHSMFKLCLFLAAGAVYMKCHTLDLNRLHGFGRDMKGLKVLFLIGALGISGVPLFSGYISKTLIHEGIVEYIELAGAGELFFKISEWLFLISGGMTFSYMTKLFIAIFVEKPGENTIEAPHGKKLSVLSYIAVGIPAAVILFFGLMPGIFINGLGTRMAGFNNFCFNAEQLEILHGIKIFSFSNLKGSCISIGLGVIFYLLIRKFLTRPCKDGTREYLDKWPAWLDLEELIYRPLILKILPGVFGWLFTLACDKLPKFIWKCILGAGKAIGIAFAGLVPSIITGLQKTLFRPLRENVTHSKIQKLKIGLEVSEEKHEIVSSSISYGMLFICIGLCCTMIYLLVLLFC